MGWILFLMAWLVAIKLHKNPIAWIVTGVLFILVIGIESYHYVYKKRQARDLELLEMNRIFLEDQMRDVEERLRN